jgi:hypothetical protein
MASLSGTVNRIQRPVYLAAVDITPYQAAQLRDSVRTCMGFFHGVQVRMYALGVPTDDPPCVLFREAEESLRRLASVLHDMSIVRERRPGKPGGE